MELKLWRFCRSPKKTRPLPIVPKWNWNIPGKGNVDLKDTGYQSYQSGIETFFSCRRRCVYWLPIVPKWNWNPAWYWTTQTAKTATNRTKVELKLGVSALYSNTTASYQSYQSGIETGINAGGAPGRFPYQSYQSGIETGKRKWYLTTWFLPIVPKWNWNMGIMHEELLAWATTNRTKVELKLQAYETGWQSDDYQSYQSGIETPVELQSLLCHFATNRTKVELKRTTSRCSSIGRINLPIVPKWNWNIPAIGICLFRTPTNRTKVELKPDR